MPCAIKSVPSTFWQRVHMIPLTECMTLEEIALIEKESSSMVWNSGIPGGFVKNVPQRLVNSFGDGSGYDAQYNCVGDKWDNAYWTPAVHQSDSTLVTPVEPLPLWLKLLGARARNLASEKYDITMNEHGFNLAVCNKYVKKSDEIAAHTDDNEWYTKDLPEGPMFASLTIYPDKKPNHDNEYARFELYIDEKWCHYKLPHASLLLMPSCIPHRVRRCVHGGDTMFERINITLRSVPALEKDAFNSMRGMSNHARYYRLPIELIIAQHKDTRDHIQKIKSAFNECLQRHSNATLKTISKVRRKIHRQTLVAQLKAKGHLTSKLKGNVVDELLEAVAAYHGI